jgi:hypothetical protein
MRNYIIAFTMLSSLIMPAFSYAQNAQPVKLDYSGLVKCDGVVSPNEPNRQKKCDFNALMDMVKSTINWLFVITVPIVTALMAYAGLLYMTGTQGNIGTAKKIFPTVATGFIIMLVAWISVITVVNWFISENNKAIIGTFVNTPSSVSTGGTGSYPEGN